MRNRVDGGTGNYKQAIFFGLLTCLFLLAPSTRALGQAALNRHSKPKQHAQNKTNPQPDLVQTPKPEGMPFVHIVPYGPPIKLKTLPPASSAGGLFSYWGGPVISNIHVVEVLWGSFVDAPSTGGLPQYFTDVTNSTYFDLLSE